MIRRPSAAIPGGSRKHIFHALQFFGGTSTRNARHGLPCAESIPQPGPSELLVLKQPSSEEAQVHGRYCQANNLFKYHPLLCQYGRVNDLTSFKSYHRQATSACCSGLCFEKEANTYPASCHLQAIMGLKTARLNNEIATAAVA